MVAGYPEEELLLLQSATDRVPGIRVPGLVVGRSLEAEFLDAHAVGIGACPRWLAFTLVVVKQLAESVGEQFGPVGGPGAAEQIERKEESRSPAAKSFWPGPGHGVLQGRQKTATYP